MINQFASTPKYSTGAGERFYYLSQEFKKQGINTTILSASYNHLFLNFPEATQLFNKEEIIDGGIFYWVKVRSYSPKRSIGRVFSFFEFLMKLFLFPIRTEHLPQLVIVSSMSIFPIYYALYLKKRYKIPFILEVRDIWPLTITSLGGYSKNNLFVKILSFTEKVAYKNANWLISVLPNFGDHLNSLAINQKWTWIPNGIISNRITQSEAKGKVNYNLPKGKFVIAYAGAIGKANAMEYIIEAAAILQRNEKSNVHFLIVGDGPEKERLVMRSEKLTNVTFLEKIPKESVQTLLEQADAAIISWRDLRLYEFGVSANKYNDYMLSKKPIISASSIKNDPVLLADCGIRCEPENPQAISESAYKLSKMKSEELIMLGENGYKFVLKNTDYEKLATKYLDVINEVI